MTCLHKDLIISLYPADTDSQCPKRCCKGDTCSCRKQSRNPPLLARNLITSQGKERLADKGDNSWKEAQYRIRRAVNVESAGRPILQGCVVTHCRKSNSSGTQISQHCDQEHAFGERLYVERARPYETSTFGGRRTRKYQLQTTISKLSRLLRQSSTCLPADEIGQQHDSHIPITQYRFIHFYGSVYD